MKNSKANRLINETSPYLLQHAYNPVDWYAWGSEALQLAKTYDKPILLSIGYAACHWCHVMEHESFEDESIAQIMNEHFVPIKVDREERPDLDDIYMRSVQMMTGHGGWPMTVFLTPDLKPFYGGTYFPPADRHGMPSFRRVLLSVAKTWQEKRQDVQMSSEELTNYLVATTKVEGSETELNKDILDAQLMRLLSAFDHQYGGFGGAPKFPQAAALFLALRGYHKKAELKILIDTTLDKMANGGINDQIGGGFARYSVDRQWMVPHFEKMLYDNALLTRLYLEAYLATGNQYYLGVGRKTLDFVLNELTNEEGAFYSSLDADSEGHEGKFYVFNDAEVQACLGQDADFARKVYTITQGGNFEGGTNVLNLVDTPQKLAKKLGLSDGEFAKKIGSINERLLDYRSRRVRPSCDEKVLTSWNSLMISGFVAGYRVLQDDRYLKAARRATEFLLKHLMKDGRLFRTWGKGKSKLNAYLDDYAYLTEALLDLASVDSDSRWLATAVNLADVMIDHFFDSSDGSFFYTSDDHEALITRPKSFYDAPTPSASASAAFSLLRLAKITDNDKYRTCALATIKLYAPYFAKGADQFAYFGCALDFHLAEGPEIVLSVRKNIDETILFSIHEKFLPNAVTVVKDDSSNSNWPLFSNRAAIDGKPTVYICRNFSCQKPINSASELSETLAGLERNN